MNVLYLLAILICLWSGPAKSQFFYSTYTPTAQFQAIFRPQPAPIPQQQLYSGPGAAVTYNLPPIDANSAEFRGFGYRTDYKNGATSTVYYVTGPESSVLRNFPSNLPNINIKTQQNVDNRARSLASNLIDANAFPNVAQHIRSILQPFEFQQIFDMANTGAFNFYTYPAGTAPLIRPATAVTVANDEKSTETGITTTTTTTTPATITDTTTTTTTEATDSSAAQDDTVEILSAVAETMVASRTLPAPAETEDATSSTEAATSTASEAASSEASSEATSTTVATVTTTTTEAPLTSAAITEATSMA